jgi:dethiobiotin synthetase
VAVRGLFVTGTDTGVGKTVLSASLVAALAAAGERVRAFKPVVTGLDDSTETGKATAGPVARSASAGLDGTDTDMPWPADHVLLGAAAGMTPEAVSPLRFGPAVSPHLAAELAGEPIEPERLLAAAAAAEESDGTLIVEGVGGLLVPLRENYSVCDFAVALGLPLLIAARPGLGTINHTLLTLRVARAAGLDVCAVVLTPWPQMPSVMESSNRETIARLGAVEVQTLPRVPAPEPSQLAHAGDELPWRQWLQPQ